MQDKQLDLKRLKDQKKGGGGLQLRPSEWEGAQEVLCKLLQCAHL